MKCWNCGSKKLTPMVDSRGHPYFLCECGASNTGPLNTAGSIVTIENDLMSADYSSKKPTGGHPAGALQRSAAAARRRKAKGPPPE